MMLPAYYCGMVKDKKIKIVTKLIKLGEITMISEVFDYVPVTPVALMLGSNWDQLNKRIQEPGIFRVNEIVLLASYFEVEEKVLFDLVMKQIVLNRNKRKKK